VGLSVSPHRWRPLEWIDTVPRTITSIVAAAAAGITLGGIAVGVANRSEGIIMLVSSRSGEYVSPAANQPFSITAKPIRRLYPGASRQTSLTVTNPYHFPLLITNLQGQVVGTSRRACKPIRSNVAIGRYAGRFPLTVPRFGARTIDSLHVSMPLDASPECAHTTFTIRLVGTATRARG
jgi:hypothetical protein